MIIGLTQSGPSDPAKQLVHLAIAAGRSLQSSQTGFVHYHYRPIDYPTYDTIPLYENFLMALAMLRDRSSEGFAEGKALLDKLLNFQCFEDSASLGNFPVYLHQYPQCTDRYLGYHLLPVIYWVLKQFTLILGADLRERVSTAARTLLDYCVKVETQHPAPVHLAVKLAAASEAFGRLWDDKDLEQSSAQVLEQLRTKVEAPENALYCIPTSIADVLVALQMVYSSVSESPWRTFWERIWQTWYIDLASYTGPALRVSQAREEAEPTLYDLYMGFFAGRFSQRALAVRPYQLQSILIHGGHETVVQPALPFEEQGTIDGRQWLFQQHPGYGLALLQRKERDPANESVEAVLRLIWGDLNCAHSLVCQGGSAESICYELVEGGVDLLFRLPKEVPPESKQRNREVLFFIDAQEGLQIHIGREDKATAFQLGDELRLSARGMDLRIRFALEEGSGRFFGHISPGNRPAQLNSEGPDRFAAFDRQIFLRTVSRDADCMIRAQVRWKPRD